MAAPRITILIPAHNESENVGPTLQNATDALRGAGAEVAAVVVDDHSDDDTYDVAIQAGEAAGVPVRALRLSRRSGSHTAIRAGLSIISDADAVLCIAADGQEPPAVFAEILARWRDGHEVVWGLRNSRADEPWRIKIFALLFYRMMKHFCETPAPVDMARADFFLLDRRVVEALRDCPERNTSFLGLIAWAGYRQGAVNYDRQERRSGTSKWNFSSRIRLAKDWLIAFSGVPLRLATYCGTLLALTGFAYAIHVLVNSIYGRPAEGWSSLMIVVLLLSGVQLVILGVMGEFLWRTLEETRRRPLFFVERDSREG